MTMWMLCTDCKRTWISGGYRPCKATNHHWASQDWPAGPYEPSDASYPPDVGGHRYTVKVITKIDPEAMKAAAKALTDVFKDLGERLQPAVSAMGGLAAAYKSLYDSTTFADLRKYADAMAAKAAAEDLEEVFNDIAHSPLRQPDRIDLSGAVIERRREGLQVSVPQRRREAELVRERTHRAVLLPRMRGQGKHRSGHRS